MLDFLFKDRVSLATVFCMSCAAVGVRLLFDDYFIAGTVITVVSVIAAFFADVVSSTKPRPVTAPVAPVAAKASGIPAEWETAMNDPIPPMPIIWPETRRTLP